MRFILFIECILIFVFNIFLKQNVYSFEYMEVRKSLETIIKNVHINNNRYQFS